MFVAIEGIDGSGKGTTTRSLIAELEKSEHKVDSISFPRYGETLYGKVVGRYLDGEFGTDTHPLLHGTLYAIDRFESKAYLEASIEFNDVVVCDRYIPSNLCYSAMKSDKEGREDVVKHFIELEYGIFQMPVPDVIFFLDVPVKFAVQNIAKKAAREYTGKAADIHEADELYLGEVRDFYANQLMKFHPKTRFETIQCERNGHLIPLDKVLEKVYTRLLTMMKGDRT